MDFVPDYDLARKQVRNNLFNTYTSAYVVTNEELRSSMGFIPKKCENALVVAASGDHPLFCSLYGAKHVDTFDVSYNAKCLMDIKVAALQCLQYLEYRDFLEELYALRDNKTKTITDIAKMDEILYRLPKIEADYIYSLSKEPLFCRGPRPTATGIGLTFAEYCNLRKKVTKPYNFMLTNVCNLSGCLTKSYDFIHLSNIFDYVIENDYAELLLSIIKFVNPGGRIVMECFEDDSHFYLNYMGPKILALSDKSFTLKQSYRTHILERTR